MEKKLIVVIDAQNDFEHQSGALYIQGAEKLIPLQNTYIRTLKPWDVEAVIYTFDTHTLEQYKNSEEAKQFNPHCIKGSWGHRLAIESATVPRNVPVFKLEKNVFSMWEEPHLMVVPLDSTTLRTHHPLPRDEFFQLMFERGVRSVEVIGVALNFCVKWAVDGFVAKGFKVTIPQTLTIGIDVGNGDLDLNPFQIFKQEILDKKVAIV